MSFQGIPARLVLVISCKGCSRNLPTGLADPPREAIAVRCPACGEHRQYRPSEVFEGKIAFEVIQGGRR